MLNKVNVLAWEEIDHDLYEENGHVFGVELDLFNSHTYFYHRQGNLYDYFYTDDIYVAIDKFNKMSKEE